MRVYFDTSAAGKLLRPERETAALQDFIDNPDVEAVGSWLLVTELRRVAEINDIPQRAVTAILEGFDILPLLESDYELAGILPSKKVRSLDALHLTVASQARVDHLVTYDVRMKESALMTYGLSVLEPGSDPENQWLPAGYAWL